jgi:hypothetical protein
MIVIEGIMILSFIRAVNGHFLNRKTGKCFTPITRRNDDEAQCRGRKNQRTDWRDPAIYNEGERIAIRKGIYRNRCERGANEEGSERITIQESRSAN